MKKLSTTVSTGDIFTGIDGLTYKVGLQRSINGKKLIDLHISISATSGITKQVTTTQLNKLIKN